MSSPSTTKQLDKQLGETPKTAFSIPADNKLLLQAQEVPLDKQLEMVKIQLQNEQLKVKTLSSRLVEAEAKEKQSYVEIEKVKTLSNRLHDEAVSKDKQNCLEIEHYKRRVQRYENIVTQQDETIKESSERYKDLEDAHKKKSKDSEEIREKLREALEREKILYSMLQNQGGQLRKVVEEKQQFSCWKNCFSLCFLYIFERQGFLPCNEMLSKIAMALFLQNCYSGKDTWNQDSVKCALTHTLFEKSGLVNKVLEESNIADHYKMENYLKETFKGEAVIMALGEDVSVGHCVVFDNTGESSRFVDPQKNNKLLTVKDLTEATSVQIFKVNFFVLKNILKDLSSSDPNGYHTCIVHPSPVL